MSESLLDNNLVTVSGKIYSDPVVSHEVYGETFYNFTLEIPRLSSSEDKVPITVSERLIEIKKIKVGQRVMLDGQFRSYNNYKSNGNKLILTVFARDIKFISEDEDEGKNSIFLNGFLCKKPIYRTTPFGREISDILLAINRNYGKSDYIPCIAWGRNARYTNSFTLGENVKVWGRIQSREYQKKLDSGEVDTRIAYEVSVSKLEICEDESDKDKEVTNENTEVNNDE